MAKKTFREYSSSIYDDAFKKIAFLVNSGETDPDIYAKNMESVATAMTLDGNNPKINRLFVLLKSLSRFRIGVISKFLNDISFDERFEIFLNDIAIKIKANEKLSNYEVAILDTYITYNNKINFSEEIFGYFVKTCLKKECRISFESLKKLFVIYGESYLQEFLPTASVIFRSRKDFPEQSLSDSEAYWLGLGTNQLVMDEKILKNLYNNGDSSVMIAFFHELNHGVCEERMYDVNYASLNVINEIKETCLLSLPGYKEENYDRISFELLANYYAVVYYIAFRDSIGMPLSDDKIEEFYKEYEMLKEKTQSQIRTLNGVSTTVDELFGEYIKDKPVLLDFYPALRYLYEETIDGVFMKSPEKLRKEYNSLSVKEKKLLGDFYTYYLKDSNIKHLN